MDGVTSFHVSFLSLDRYQNDLRLTVFLTEGKRVFHMSIISFVLSVNGFASGRLSYGQAFKFHPRPTYYVTVLVFVCLYVCTTLTRITLRYLYKPNGETIYLIRQVDDSTLSCSNEYVANEIYNQIGDALQIPGEPDKPFTYLGLATYFNEINI